MQMIFFSVHVRLGEHDTKRFTDCSFELQQCSTPVDVPVESVLTHKDYNTASKHNDIALIRVARDISFQSCMNQKSILDAKVF